MAGVPGVISVWHAGVVEAGGGEENGRVGADGEAVGVEDANHVRCRAYVAGAVRAEKGHVLKASGEGEGFKVAEDGVIGVGFLDGENGAVREDQRAFGEEKGGEDSETLAGGCGDGIGA